MKKTDTSAPEVQPTMAFPTTPPGATRNRPPGLLDLRPKDRRASARRQVRLHRLFRREPRQQQSENVPNIGPIPRGDWTVAGPPVDSKDHGPYVLKLNPAPSTETHGRSGFLMHSDSKEHPGSASHGCVILPRAVREAVWQSGDRDLEVVAEIPASESPDGK
jgi:hypothetical protein